MYMLDTNASNVVYCDTRCIWFLKQCVYLANVLVVVHAIAVVARHGAGVVKSERRYSLTKYPIENQLEY